MIVESSVATTAAPTSRKRLLRRNLPLRWKSGLPLAVFVGLLTGVVILQVLSGAYRSEFSSYPDEPAHYVTSVMVTGFLKHTPVASPLTFARTYYAHYPKVALGHWPPVFYAVQALWMLLFSVSRASVRLEIAVTTAVLAFSIFWRWRYRFGSALALAGGVAAIGLPLMQTYSSEEMAEMLLTLFCFWAVVYLVQYIEGERWRDALLFALFFALAVLTKGNGWLLAMVPAIAMPLTRSMRLWLKAPFLTACVLVGAVCIPWQLLTMSMVERGWEGGTKPTAAYTGGALRAFVSLLPEVLGPALLVVAALGLGVTLWRFGARRRLSPMSAGMLALLMGVWIFHSLVPAGVEDRKLVIAVPAMIFFGLSGASSLVAVLYGWILQGEAAVRWHKQVTTAVLVVAGVACVFRVPTVHHYGFDQAAAFVANRPEMQRQDILVSSQSVGEGLLVSELAMLRPDPSAEIIRATKSMASVEWNGANYRCLYTSRAEVLRYLFQHNIRFVVVDTFPPVIEFQHDRLLRAALADSSRFEVVAHFDTHDREVPGSIFVYRSRY